MSFTQHFFWQTKWLVRCRLAAKPPNNQGEEILYGLEKEKQSLLREISQQFAKKSFADVFSTHSAVLLWLPIW